MAVYNSSRFISEERALAIASEYGLNLPDRTVGDVVVLREGDILTFPKTVADEGPVIRLTAVGKDPVDDKGAFVKGAYWVRISVVKRDGRDIVLPISAATFSRSGKSAPTKEQTYRVNGKSEPVIAGSALREAFVKGLAKKVQALTLALAQPKAELAFLKDLEGKSFKIVSTRKVYQLRLNTKEVENWGTHPADYRQTEMLAFEQIEG